MVWEISMHYYKNRFFKLENSILKYPKQHSPKKKPPHQFEPTIVIRMVFLIGKIGAYLIDHFYWQIVNYLISQIFT